ncbi:S-S bond formation pathway protein [Eptesipox virus]|uniref:S-S bond formation pathway protein n=1 Tax=Eptesipox virus TaxID=1329402 RepID=A0A220T6G2_9POXV|nr:S-S bond formation pathway protein [Eptesipox virus]ASK51299.1 S-S bond formation pathway protein [Eptesipox virus]WAH71057.1 S-S bond formation pathway protein [Eptesipox virus]
MSDWYNKYTVVLDPPKRCSKCQTNLYEALSEDVETIKAALESQPNKLIVLKSFLAFCKNKTFLYKILDLEIKRVLT